MNFLEITELMFSCLVGALIGSIVSLAFKRLTRRYTVIAVITGLCALVIGVAWHFVPGFSYWWWFIEPAFSYTDIIKYVCRLLLHLRGVPSRRALSRAARRLPKPQAIH